MPPQYTLSEEQTIEEVRTALAGLNAQKIPDKTLLQAVELFSLPWVKKTISDQEDDEALEAAAIALGAEFAWDAWFSKSRMRDRELEVFTDPRVFDMKLRTRTEQVLSAYDLSRPPSRNHIIETTNPIEDPETRRELREDFLLE